MCSAFYESILLLNTILLTGDNVTMSPNPLFLFLLLLLLLFLLILLTFLLGSHLMTNQRTKLGTWGIKEFRFFLCCKNRVKIIPTSLRKNPRALPFF